MVTNATTLTSSDILAIRTALLSYQNEQLIERAKYDLGSIQYEQFDARISGAADAYAKVRQINPID